MQSSTHLSDPSYQPLGQRRGKLDLARFSLDLSWARAVTDAARTRAYPSPPMSGSPPFPPPQSNPAFDDRGPAGFGASPAQDVPQGMRTPQTETRGNLRTAPRGPYQEEQRPPPQYSSYQRTEGLPITQSEYQYPQHQQPIAQQPQRPPPQQMGSIALYPPPHDPFQGLERPPIGDNSGYTSPKSQRKTKGHVASACVPCKKAHLRCDAQRPCSRCMSNGKEDSCIDVQHKKRGRPRLRDDREVRYEGMGPAYPPPPEHVMRRPMSMYTTSGPPMHDLAMTNRSGPYRVLKSQSGPQQPARYLEHASTSDANVYASSSGPQPRMMGQSDVPCAYLSTDFQVAKASRSFSDAVGIQSVLARKLTDMVAPGDREKLHRLQGAFEDEKKKREPNYLPPIYGKAEEERVIQSIGLSSADVNQFRADVFESLIFQGPDGQQRNIQVRLGLAKKESTYFVILILELPVTPQGMHHPLSSPYSRDSQYGYQTPQQSYGRPMSMSPFGQYPQPYSEPRVREQAMGYRQPASLGSNTAPPQGPLASAGSQQYTPPYPRHDYGHGQHPHEIPRSQIAQRQIPRSNELQLPPIRTQAGPPIGMPVSRGEDRSARLDIGGLIEGPEPQRSRP